MANGDSWLRLSRFNPSKVNFGTGVDVRLDFLRKSSILFILHIFIIATLAPQLSFSAGEQLGFGQADLSIISAGQTHTFTVEIANTDEQRARGLMYRKKMSPQKGMLFFFTANRMVTMWMKNTYIPLDILFIDQKGVIVHIAKSTVPESLDFISSRKPVISALELNSGVTNSLNIQIGDKIDHPFFTR